MAHFHGQDTEFSRNFFPAYRRGVDTLEAVTGAAGKFGTGGFALLPAIWLLSSYLEAFSESQAEISRERELAADAVAARIASKRDIATALMKIIRNDSLWEKAYAELLNSREAEREQRETPSELFRRLADHQFQHEDRMARIKSLDAEQLTHPTDTHPPLRLRLESLGFTTEELYEAGGDIRPVEPSSDLFSDSVALERDLVPDFALRSNESEAVFGRRQAGFTAMEYYALFMNRRSSSTSVVTACMD